MKFRKKPILVEAFHLTEGQSRDRGTWPAWLCDGWNAASESPLRKIGAVYPQGDALVICTLEGLMKCNVGDWIIRGVKGELYPCKPDVFAATYEPVED